MSRASALFAGYGASNSLAMSYTPVTTGTYNVAYTGATPVTTGGTGPYTYSMQTGTLPTGITLNTSTGVISGTDSTDSSGTTASGLVLRVTDSAGSPAHIDSGSFSITIAAGSWTPASLPSLLAWFEADTGLAVNSDGTGGAPSNGGTVGRWADQSGNANHLSQATSGQRPVFHSAGWSGSLGSKNSIDFTAANLTNMVTGNVAFASSGVASFFLYGNMDSATASYGRILTMVDSGNADSSATNGIIPIIRFGSAASIESYDHSDLSSKACSTGANHRMGCIYDHAGSGNTIAYVDNVAGTGATVPSVGITTRPVRIGAGDLGSGSGPDSLSCFQGSIVSIVITKAVIGSTDLSNLDTYLTGKWGT